MSQHDSIQGLRADYVIHDEAQQIQEPPFVRIFEKIYDEFWHSPDEARDAITQILNAFGDEVRAMPELAATKSRDFGRGYAMAVQDVVTLLNLSGATLQ